jgi:1,4-alpha-glucan branching enzyme
MAHVQPTRRTKVKANVDTSGLRDRPDSVEVRFVCDARPMARRVFVAGDFNAWDARSDRMRKRGGRFVKRMRLPRGTHQYKFIVDGEWIPDPAAETQAWNDFGSHNSVITV